MNKVFIDVTISHSHFVAGQGIRYTEDFGTCWTYAEDFPAEVSKVIDAYCETLAENMMRYDANEQDYVIEFWHNGERIGKALLSDYAEHFMS